MNRKYDVIELRTKVGMVFQSPTCFNVIYENVAYGLKTRR